MAKTRQDSEHTRRKLLDAADVVLRERGYGGTSARTIAAEAGVNSALVFYHFGGVDPLLLAALDRSSEARMAMHRRTVADVRTVEDLVAAAQQIYRTDLERGYLAQFSELVGAALTHPELRAAIVDRADPWVRLVEESWDRVTAGTALGRLLPAREVAHASITFYLGVNLFSVIDPDQSRTESVFALAERVAPRAKLLTMRLPRRAPRPRSPG